MTNTVQTPICSHYVYYSLASLFLDICVSFVMINLVVENRSSLRLSAALLLRTVFCVDVTATKTATTTTIQISKPQMNMYISDSLKLNSIQCQ